jgi:ketosteroid isomerase-like protein
VSEAADVITRYIGLVSDHDLVPLEYVLSDDLVARTGLGTFDKTEWIAALDRLLPILARNELRQTFDNGDTAAVFYDFVTDTEAGAVPCAEWITVRDGRITTVELLVEKASWSHVIAALQAKATTR